MTVTRGRLQKNESGYEEARSGTLYWTLSLYIEADKVASALKPDRGQVSRRRIEPDVFRRMQRGHLPSLALANAVDPLMNDIADRESQGEIKEFLHAATARSPSAMDEAATLVREHEVLSFKLPPTTSWTTEGIRFEASPENLAHDREVRLRRFWLSHNNGALSYHLSFSHFYGAYLDEAGKEQHGYDPATYYFLSLLQKLAAPKEYSLRAEALAPTPDNADPEFDVFQDNLGIDPLDRIKVAFRAETDGLRFWPFVRTVFEDDARSLFDRLARTLDATVAVEPGGYADHLIDMTSFIEAPGLKAPKSRFMFMLHDERFFKRLMPLDPLTRQPAQRKTMVQEDCYAPYAARIRELIDKADGGDDPVVRLGPEFWSWVCNRPEYVYAVTEKSLRRAPEVGVEGGVHSLITLADEDEDPDRRLGDLVSAMQSGCCEQTHVLPDRPHSGLSEERRLGTPVTHHIPAFEANRTDCLDYLFLAGFNQNIIDFMNQDTSEILDSIDPIYPENDEQSDERFFVRYANHRAMITYVRKSRSLEAGNDYIGACPYAFLIHALALHNEFLARGHEEATMARIDRIDARLDEVMPKTSPAMAALDKREPLNDGDSNVEPDEPLTGRRLHRTMQLAINKAKLAEFSEYERFRYANPFRYDTERAVFGKLEQLRGVSRKSAALALAIKSLEDHASDLAGRQQRQEDDDRRDAIEAQSILAEKAATAQKLIDAAAAKRGQLLNLLLGMTGVFGAGQMFYWIGEKTGETGAPNPLAHIFGLAAEVEPPRRLFGWAPANPEVGNAIMTITELAMFAALAFFFAMLLRLLLRPMLQLVRVDVPDVVKTWPRPWPIWRRRLSRSLGVRAKTRNPKRSGVATRASGD